MEHRGWHPRLSEILKNPLAMEKNTFCIETHMVSRFHYQSVGLFLLSAIPGSITRALVSRTLQSRWWNPSFWGSTLHGSAQSNSTLTSKKNWCAHTHIYIILLITIITILLFANMKSLVIWGMISYSETSSSQWFPDGARENRGIWRQLQKASLVVLDALSQSGFNDCSMAM